jgi:non-ribosomal peptide synthetase component F
MIARSSIALHVLVDEKTSRRSACETILELRYTASDSIALEYGDLLLRYEELNLRADRFAGYLTQLGVMPDGTVAICMDR